MQILLLLEAVKTLVLVLHSRQHAQAIPIDPESLISLRTQLHCICDIAFVVHEDIHLSLCERLPVTNICENVKENLVLLSVNLVQCNVLKADLLPFNGLKRPHPIAILKVVMVRASPQPWAVLAPFAPRRLLQCPLPNTVKAVLVRSHRRQLAKVTEHNDLHATKGLVRLFVSSLGQSIHVVKCLVRYHRDLVEDQDLSITEPLLDRRLHRAHQLIDAFVSTGTRSEGAVQRLGMDLDGSSPRWRNNCNANSDTGEIVDDNLAGPRLSGSGSSYAAYSLSVMAPSWQVDDSFLFVVELVIVQIWPVPYAGAFANGSAGLWVSFSFSNWSRSMGQG
jgi:hypothetical protein